MPLAMALEIGDKPWFHFEFNTRFMTPAERTRRQACRSSLPPAPHLRAGRQGDPVQVDHLAISNQPQQDGFSRFHGDFDADSLEILDFFLPL